MATNANAPVIPVVLQRDDPTQPWGFRIQGGADYRLHLAVKKVIFTNLSIKNCQIFTKFSGNPKYSGA